jgi:hypothetical protein
MSIPSPLQQYHFHVILIWWHSPLEDTVVPHCYSNTILSLTRRFITRYFRLRVFPRCYCFDDDIVVSWHCWFTEVIFLDVVVSRTCFFFCSKHMYCFPDLAVSQNSCFLGMAVSKYSMGWAPPPPNIHGYFPTLLAVSSSWAGWKCSSCWLCTGGRPPFPASLSEDPPLPCPQTDPGQYQPHRTGSGDR